MRFVQHFVGRAGLIWKVPDLVMPWAWEEQFFLLACLELPSIGTAWFV